MASLLPAVATASLPACRKGLPGAGDLTMLEV